MKSIQLKTAKEKVVVNGNEIEQEFKTIELIRQATNFTPPGGFNAADMINRIRILDVLEKANGELNLEDADFENLKKYVKETRWGVISKTIVEFINQFE
jgi:hypothetical protein